MTVCSWTCTTAAWNKHFLCVLSCARTHHVRHMQERLPDSFNLDPKRFDHVLNVVTINGRLHWNVHEADDTYRETVLLTQPSQREVSSAVHKLQEALAVLGHKLGCEEAAIDLGKITLCDCASLRSCGFR